MKTLNLKGRVKSLTELNYIQQAPPEDLIKPFSLEDIFFDRNGNVIRHIYTNHEGVVVSKVRYLYDDAGNYTSMAVYQDDEILVMKMFEFDENGRLIGGKDKVKDELKTLDCSIS